MAARNTASSSKGSQRGFGAPPVRANGLRPRSSEPSKRRPSSQRQLYASQIAPLLERGLEQQAEPLLRLMAQSQSPLPEVMRDLGRVLELQGAQQEADTYFRHWLNHQPNHPGQLLAQAQKAEQLQLPELALERYLSLLTHQPEHAEGLARASDLLMEQGRFADALPLLQRRLEMAAAAGGAGPAESLAPELLIQASLCAFELGQLQQAAQWAEQGLLIRPHEPVIKAIQARQQQQQGDEAAALLSADNALTWAETPAERSLVNRLIAPILLEQGLLERAETALRQALTADPLRQTLHLQLGETLLLQNQLQEGFQQYQWRAASHQRATTSRSTQLPAWDTLNQQQPLALLAESTLGDTLLFSRYAPWLKREHGLDVRLYVQLPLHSLLQEALGDAVPVEPANQLKQLEAGSVLSLLSAPAIFGTCQEHPALSKPHLKANPQTVDHWRQLLNLRRGERLVGINWHGSPLQALTERHHSDIPLALLEPLAALPNTKLISLQKGIGSEQLETCPFRHQFIGQQASVSAELRFEQTAALMSLCDWIVTDDSGPAHLAGCLGLPTIVLLPQLSNWRWGAKGNSSPWYPKTTLLRQVPDGGWQPLVEKACQIINNGTQPL